MFLWVLDTGCFNHPHVLYRAMYACMHRFLWVLHISWSLYTSPCVWCTGLFCFHWTSTMYYGYIKMYMFPGTGFFGFTILGILLAPMYYIKIGRPFSQDPEGRMENVPDAFHQLGSNYQIIIAFCGMYIVKYYISLKVPTTRLFVRRLIQANNKENVIALHHWPFVRGIHRWPVDSPHKGPVMLKATPCHDVSNIHPIRHAFSLGLLCFVVVIPPFIDNFSVSFTHISMLLHHNWLVTDESMMNNHLSKVASSVDQ